MTRVSSLFQVDCSCVPSWWNKKVPSWCLTKALRKSKYPLTPGLRSICRASNYSLFLVCWFMSDLFSLLASSHHPSWSVLPCKTGVTWLPQSLWLSRFSWCQDRAEALFVFEWLVKALGCVHVSKVLDVIQGCLGLLSSFWKISCSTATVCSRSRNSVGEAQASMLQLHLGCFEAFRSRKDTACSVQLVFEQARAKAVCRQISTSLRTVDSWLLWSHGRCWQDNKHLV